MTALHGTHRSNGKHQRHAARATQQAIRNRVAALQDSAATAIDGVAQQLSDIKDKSIETSREMERTIVKNPKSSVLLAFGVGYVLARLRKWL